MSHDEFFELIAAYVEESLPPEQRQRVCEHLQHCPLCAAAVDDFRENLALFKAELQQDQPLEGAAEKIRNFYDQNHFDATEKNAPLRAADTDDTYDPTENNKD